MPAQVDERVNKTCKSIGYLGGQARTICCYPECPSYVLRML